MKSIINQPLRYSNAISLLVSIISSSSFTYAVKNSRIMSIKKKMFRIISSVFKFETSMSSEKASK